MSALADVLPALRCPVCAAPLVGLDRRLACPAGHSFDVARQGYVTLGTALGADSAAMVADRDRFLAAGHYRALTDALVRAAGGGTGLVVDLAGGTGQHLAAVLDARPGGYGLVVDRSAAALRRAARAHPRAAAIGADVWGRLPLADGCATVVLNVFGPRDAAEIERILAPGGRLVAAAPLPDHLAELVGPLGLVGVDPDKAQRRAAAFARFDPLDARAARARLALSHADVRAVVGMGPSARHVAPDVLAARVAALPDPVEVGLAVEVTTYAPRGSGRPTCR